MLLLFHHKMVDVDHWNLSPIGDAMAAKILELRAELKPETDAYAAANGGAASPIMTDQSLIRYLKGENYDLPVVAKRMRFTLKWREEVGADAVRAGHIARGTRATTSIEGADKITRTVILGSTMLGETRAKDGDAIVIRFPGQIDPAMVKASVPFDELTTYCISYVEWVAETLERLSLAAGRIVRYHVVYDMSGLGLKHMSSDFVFVMKAQTKLFQVHFAELLSTITVINAPSLFTAVFALVRPMMSAETLSKLSVIGCDRDAWRARLVEMFPDASMPALLGGTMPNSELSMPVGFDFELAGSDTSMTAHDLAVSAGGKESVDLVVPPASTAAWKFHLTRGSDITLTATRGDDGTEVGSWVRVASASDGFWTNSGDEPVTLHLEFDNSFSWLKSKDVKVFTDVEATVSGEAVAAMWDGGSEAEQEAAAGGAAGAAAAK